MKSAFSPMHDKRLKIISEHFDSSGGKIIVCESPDKELNPENFLFREFELSHFEE